MDKEAPAGHGPLAGVRVVEIAGIGPGPFCAMLLADMGADVVRVERPGPSTAAIPMDSRYEVMNRGRRSIALDLKVAESVRIVGDMVARADILIEGFRPGVMERLGLGPEACLAINPKLVYGRMTGWGQSGPLARAAGHDISYIAITGVLDAIGPEDGAPVPPLNLVGDFGGGGMLLAMGVLAAHIDAQKSGVGQVVDAAMSDGAALLMASTYGLKAAGLWDSGRGGNILDGGAPFYAVYQTADRRWISVAAIEPQFYVDLVRRLGLRPEALPPQHDKREWPRLRGIFADAFRQRSLAEWNDLMEGTDACYAPVLSMDDAPRHPHMAAREAFVSVDGVVQPAPAPRFSRTPSAIARPPAKTGEHTHEVLRDWGVDPEPRTNR